MAEYINRDAALDIVNGWREQLIPTYGKNDEYVKCLETVAEHLETLPAADVVERKTGKWETDEIGCAICSVCGNYAFETTTHHISGWYPRFCPNCGAKMEVDDDV